MRFRLLRRRLTISAPRMAVRSALPWPLRWALVAIVLGFCAAIGLWAFEFGKDIAGIEDNQVQDLQRLQVEVKTLQNQLITVKDERDKAMANANSANILMTTEKAAQERLSAHIKQLEIESQKLRDDLGFFEKLIPTAGTQGLAIRSIQADMLNDRQVKWQVLVIQPLKNAPEFNGRFDVTFSGLQSGKPWAAPLPGGAQNFKLKQYTRLEGVFDLPPQTTLKGISIKVMDGAVVKASQSIKL